MTDSKTKPNRLREYREAAGLTQQELADKVSAGRVTIVRAEQGSQAPSLELAGRLADELETTIDQLFSVRRRVDADTRPGEEPPSSTKPRKPRAAGKRLHALYTKRRRAGDELDTGLWQARIDIAKTVGILEGVDLPEYGLREADQDTIADIYEELTNLARWLDSSLEVVANRMDDAHLIEKIRKLREDTNGRSEAEIKTAKRLASRLERKRERVLEEADRG